MIEGPIRSDDAVTHLRTGNPYIVDGAGLVKIGDAPGWTPAVVYHKPGGSELFTRDEAAFRQNFGRMEDPQ